MKLPSIEELLKAGMHFGHRTSKWHPKMEPFIFAVRQGVHIINLEQSASQLVKACEAAREVAARGGSVLFLGTKKQARPVIKKYASEVGMPYVAQRWLGGMLTNFVEIRKRIKRLKDLEALEQDSEYENKYTKRERLEFTRERETLESLIGGIRELKGLPDMIYIVDIRSEQTAVREANRKRVPIIALTDTNTNPDLITYPIPANDDAIKSLEIMTRYIAEAIKAGQAEMKDKKADQEMKLQKEGDQEK